MAKLGVTAAARAVGHNRATLWRYIKSGKLSASVDGTRGHVIDTAELMRVFGALQPPATVAATVQSNGMQPSATDATVARLQAELDAAERERNRLATDLEHTAADLKRTTADLERERAEKLRLLGIVEQAQRLLTDQRTTPATSTTTRPKAPQAPRRRRARRRPPTAQPTRPAPAPSFTDFVAGLLRPR